MRMRPCESLTPVSLSGTAVGLFLIRVQNLLWGSKPFVMAEIQKNKQFLRASVSILGFLVLALVAYLLLLPLYPALKYEFFKQASRGENFKNFNDVKKATEEIIVNSPSENFGNRVIIAKIGVDAPIIESNSEDYGLARGAWHLSQGSTPDIGGNTVLTGHRFKYLPPSNLTFFLLDKLEKDDIISIIWQEKNYYYKVFDKRIVGASDPSILAPSEKPILTLFTCDPIYSEKNRLVVIGELMTQ